MPVFLGVKHWDNPFIWDKTPSIMTIPSLFVSTWILLCAVWVLDVDAFCLKSISHRPKYQVIHYMPQHRFLFLASTILLGEHAPWFQITVRLKWILVWFFVAVSGTDTIFRESLSCNSFSLFVWTWILVWLLVTVSWAGAVSLERVSWHQ